MRHSNKLGRRAEAALWHEQFLTDLYNIGGTITMDDVERLKIYQYIAEQNQMDCPDLTAARVEEIHQGLIRNSIKGTMKEEGCIDLVIEDLRAQGLGTFN
jgi:hypothetical protein